MGELQWRVPTTSRAEDNCTQGCPGSVATRVARWDGSAWQALGAGIQGAQVSCLASYGGKLYVGGSFTTAGIGAAENLAVWDGGVWTAINANNTVARISCSGTCL